MYGTYPSLSKEYILSKVSQKQIFEHYLKINVVFDCLIISPLRNDKNPTAGFKYSDSGVLMFRDFSGHFWGDCFEVVMKIYNLDFFQALSKIEKDLINGNFQLSNDGSDLGNFKNSCKKNTIISYKKQKLTPLDVAYWERYNITEEILNFYQVISLDTLWVNGKIIYSYHYTNPGYLYCFGKEKYKAYFPTKTSYRFITNDNSFLQGYYQLPPTGDILILTKSLKDVMVLYSYGIPAVAPQAESILISQEQFEDLSSRFKTIISFMDFDYAGVTLTNKLKKTYGMKYMFLTNGRFNTKDYQEKDISDFRCSFGHEATLTLISEYEKANWTNSSTRTNNPCKNF
jgi:5S rRNA maturation endonuclease (ribonuclease M5)